MGRSQDCDLQLTSERFPTLISRVHCFLTWRMDHWLLQDNKSVNGVAVNGVRVLEQRLNTGDVIAFGPGTAVKPGQRMEHQTSEYQLKVAHSRKRSGAEAMGPTFSPAKRLKRSLSTEHSREDTQQALLELQQKEEELRLVREQNLALKTLEEKLSAAEKDRKELADKLSQAEEAHRQRVGDALGLDSMISGPGRAGGRGCFERRVERGRLENQWKEEMT